MKINFKYQLQKLVQLSKAQEQIELAAENDLMSLHDQLMPFFINRFLNALQYNDPNYIFEQVEPTLCGCLGKLNGEPECSCVMSRLMYLYRFHIAQYVIEQQLEYPVKKECTIEKELDIIVSSLIAQSKL